MAKKIPTEKESKDFKLTNVDKINYFIDFIVNEVKILEKCKCNENPTNRELIDVIVQTETIARINEVLNNIAIKEYKNK